MLPAALPFVAPAALAGLAYLNARTSLSYDVHLISSYVKATINTSRREKADRLNSFYKLEEYAQNRDTANNLFLIYDNRQWTYKETYEIVLKYGTWLKDVQGVKSKDVVAIDHMNSERFVFIWLGLWSIGAKPAFINYNLTSKALAHCVRVSTASVVLVDPEIASNVSQDVYDELPNIKFVIVTPELEADVMRLEGIRQPDSARSGEIGSAMSALIYTSGTTGLPKPAIVSWSKAVTSAYHVPNWLGLKQGDVFYTCMPLYHSSAALLGLHSMLTGGLTICIGHKFSTKSFWRDVRASNATAIQYVGETCRYLLAAQPQIDQSTGENLDKKHKVRLAFGNGLRPDVWDKFKERFGIDTIGEFYAATEGTGSSWNLSNNSFSRGAIGRNGALAGLALNAMIAVVELDWETEAPWRDPKTGLCKKVARGESGELMYKLDPDNINAKFQGYFNNKSASDGKVIRDVIKKGDAYFRTGDVVSWDTEGRTYFSDRIGDTFRWKSENVSTNEVSESLGNHPSVHEANVYGVELPHHDGRAGCVAIVLAEAASENLMASLAEHAKMELPKFAVPLFIRIAKEMQTTGTNKQQKHVLRQQGVDPSKTEGDDVYWLKNGTYMKFDKKEWQELNGGSVKL